ncbi:MAG: HEAT repeat domain-containing protein [Methanobacterium sp.]|jgi:HEAT repeat protein
MDMTEEQINKLINKLDDEDYDVRKNVEDILVKIKQQSIGPLIKALNHENPEIQIESARILGKMADETALNALIEALKDGNPDFRREVTLSINKIVEKDD